MRAKKSEQVDNAAFPFSPNPARVINGSNNKEKSFDMKPIILSEICKTFLSRTSCNDSAVCKQESRGAHVVHTTRLPSARSSGPLFASGAEKRVVSVERTYCPPDEVIPFARGVTLGLS
jgi:hypothetical protein